MPRIRLRVSREVVAWVAVAAIVLVMQWPMLKGTWYKRTGAQAPLSAITWHTELDAAMAEAARLERPIPVDFAADWCPPCITMKHDVWPDQPSSLPSVVATCRCSSTLTGSPTSLRSTASVASPV
jgi:thiol:disulfide interchange protein